MQKYTIDEINTLLKNLDASDKIELRKTPMGEFVITRDGTTKADILREHYTDLIDQPISASEAAKKYDMHQNTIYKWKKQGYITVLSDDGYRAYLNEADIAYCVDVYRQKQEDDFGVYGRPLLDEAGLPYEVKHPALSIYRQNKK